MASIILPRPEGSFNWILLVSVLLFGIFVYLLAPVLTPFIAAALLSYLGDPLVDRLEARKLGRTLSVIIVFSVIFSVLTLFALIVVPLLESQISYLLKSLPQHLEYIKTSLLPALADRLNISTSVFNLDTFQQSLKDEWRQAGNIILNIVKSISSSGIVLLVWAGNLVLIPVVTFYLLRDWDILVEKIQHLLPRKIEPTISQLARESDDVLAAFLRGQLLVMLALGIVYSSGLWMIDLKLAFLIGMLAGLVSFVPYLGFIVGIVAAGIAMLLQTQDVMQLIPVIIVFGIGQILEGMLLTPMLVGDRIGLHPVAVIFAVMAGGQLVGFIGILLALPVAAVIAVLARHAQQQYLASDLYEHNKKAVQASENTTSDKSTPGNGTSENSSAS